MNNGSEEAGYVRPRVANACDGCKARKVKCDGQLPCTYCVRRQRSGTCHYSPPQQKRRPRPKRDQPAEKSRLSGWTDSVTTHEAVTDDRRSPATTTVATTAREPLEILGGCRLSNGMSSIEEHEETDVPREARLLRDAQGKLVFIGDCAPLSFFQTVRQLVCSRVDAEAFAPQTSGYSVLENVPSRTPNTSAAHSRAMPAIKTPDIQSAVSFYFSVSTGLVDLFVDNSRLADDISQWASQGRTDGTESAVFYLVLAIGFQKTNEDVAQEYFIIAREEALSNMSGSLSVGTVQAFTLITLYMLGACQINGAFLFFGNAVRAAYSIGIHRTEVNSRFGLEVHKQRDRLWKSLRVVDLYLSTSMGRPPVTSDVDCTVSYFTLDNQGHEVFDILNASVQIFLIIECVVLEVYSRKKITLQLTEGISRQLREFSQRWLQQLKDTVSAVDSDVPKDREPEVNGACQVLASYYYAVMLVSRPFLMYELHRRLSPESSAMSGTSSTTGKTKLADACIDAASFMTETTHNVIDKGFISGCLPLLVSWLFASSLTLGVGLLGGFGRILEKHTRMSITVLEYLGKYDAHAKQYSLIAKSLLATSLKYLENREAQERLERTESSAQLFGLVSREGDVLSSQGKDQVKRGSTAVGVRREKSTELVQGFSLYESDAIPPTFPDLDMAGFAFPSSLTESSELLVSGSGGDDHTDSGFGGLNLFPLLDSAGHIDLAHYL